MGSSATFEARLEELGRQVGDGVLAGGVEVDQVYARYQHEGMDLKHPRGGRAKYLESPLYEKHRDYYGRLADHVLDGTLTDAMRDVVESLSTEVYDNAPVEFHDLRRSGHPTVTDGDALVYDRPAEVHRLTALELRAKAESRALGFPHDH